jgi:hypothetical protein
MRIQIPVEERKNFVEICGKFCAPTAKIEALYCTQKSGKQIL